MKRILPGVVLAAAALALAIPLKQPAAAPARGLEIYFVDVEGGAATLIVTPQDESVLIDSGWPGEGGRDAKRIEHAARYVAGLKQIDHYVTTHWHTDHYGGIEELRKLMPIGRFWDRGIPTEATDGAKDFPTLIAAYRRAGGDKSSTLRPGDTLPLRAPGDAPLEIQVVAGGGRVIGEGKKELPLSCGRHIPAPSPDESDNKMSLAFLLKYGRFQFLNCGDLTWNLEHKLVCPKNRVGKVDLWQVTHHGWKASGNPALVQAIQPRVAVITNGPKKGNSPEVFATLKKSPSIEAIYQLHRSVENGPESNTTPERIANLEEECKGEFLMARVNPERDRYTIYKGAKDALQSFPVR